MTQVDFDLACEHEDCREPFTEMPYVVLEGMSYCLLCFLVRIKGMDPDDAWGLCDA